ncbi:unnamed protein product [Ostreobium quekettii]|uniref:J domain-containing protein n=1 Tax=Ostreobium quekettii TaxID=121088 RepID=A0A8S1J360_9CHLO|nr:unnamed protein product [Ostreobium quekettii]|eukprot:evm.model.scf_63.16 EVM.evm.TU.scf_63.16   scf_63:114032-115619(-)
MSLNRHMNSGTSLCHGRRPSPTCRWPAGWAPGRAPGSVGPRHAFTACRATVGPFDLLELPRGSSREEVRQAYLAKMKHLHPDVNPKKDTTEEAAALNAAYEHLMNAPDEDWLPEVEAPALDPFDKAGEPATELFVNPFACDVNPLQWRELQAVARVGDDPEAALSAARVGFSSGAVQFLSAAQMAAVKEELGRMESNLDYEGTSWYLSSCLNRARRANDRFRGEE